MANPIAYQAGQYRKPTQGELLTADIIAQDLIPPYGAYKTITDSYQEIKESDNPLLTTGGLLGEAAISAIIPFDKIAGTILGGGLLGTFFTNKSNLPDYEKDLLLQAELGAKYKDTGWSQSPLDKIWVKDMPQGLLDAKAEKITPKDVYHEARNVLSMGDMDVYYPGLLDRMKVRFGPKLFDEDSSMMTTIGNKYYLDILGNSKQDRINVLPHEIGHVVQRETPGMNTGTSDEIIANLYHRIKNPEIIKEVLKSKKAILKENPTYLTDYLKKYAGSLENAEEDLIEEAIYRTYLRAGGEAQARAAVARFKMSRAERAVTPWQKSMDMPYSQQFKFDARLFK